MAIYEHICPYIPKGQAPCNMKTSWHVNRRTSPKLLGITLNQQLKLVGICGIGSGVTAHWGSDLAGLGAGSGETFKSLVSS